MQALRRIPVVVVLGATGAGKSKLALELGAKFTGEIISADSMQVYQGLDIITNKVTAEELQQCPHHLLGIVHPLQRFTVVDFRNKALPLIDGLLKRGELPIIVGGTNYYIEALLWKVLIANEENGTGNLLFETRGEVERLRVKRRKTSVLQETSDATHSPDLMKASRQQTLTSCRDNSIETTVRSWSTPNVVKRSQPLVSKGDSNHENASAMEEMMSNCISDESVKSAMGNESNHDEALTTPHASNILLKGGDSEVLNIDVNSAMGSEHSLQHDKAWMEQEGASNDSDEGDFEVLDVDVNSATSSELHSLLAQVDPQMAAKLHPNDRRKVIRSLQVWEQHDIPHSELLQDQRSQEGGSHLGGPLRYPEMCVLWVQCDQAVLDARLDKRVDKMMEAGLVRELEEFHRDYNEQRLAGHLQDEDLYTQGIFQSIGFKEFHQYLVLKAEEKRTEKGERALREGTDRLKTATRQYARRQLKWIRNRFLKRGSNSPAVYGLDSTAPEEWDQNVLGPALQILQAKMEGRECGVSPLPCMEPESQEEPQTFACDVCGGRQFVGRQQWEAHLKSRRHYKKARKRKLRALMGYEDGKLPAAPTASEARSTEAKAGSPEVEAGPPERGAGPPESGAGSPAEVEGGSPELIDTR